MSEIVLSAVIFALLWFIWAMMGKHSREVRLRQDMYNIERADLLNRIQAGTYAEYKTHEIRLVKAQAGENPVPPPIEQL